MQGKDTDRRKLDDRDYSVKCVQCGEYFEAKRSDASYCSPHCRKAAHYAPIKRQNALDELKQITRRLHDIRTQYPRDKEFFEAFVSLSRVAAYQAASYESMEYNSGHIPAEMKEKAIKESNAAAAKMDRLNAAAAAAAAVTGDGEDTFKIRPNCPNCKTHQYVSRVIDVWMCFKCDARFK